MLHLLFKMLKTWLKHVKTTNQINIKLEHSPIKEAVFGSKPSGHDVGWWRLTAPVDLKPRAPGAPGALLAPCLCLLYLLGICWSFPWDPFWNTRRGHWRSLKIIEDHWFCEDHWRSLKMPGSLHGFLVFGGAFFGLRGSTDGFGMVKRLNVSTPMDPNTFWEATGYPPKKHSPVILTEKDNRQTDRQTDRKTDRQTDR